jgi:hypothetical protein
MNRQTLTDARYHTIGHIGTAVGGKHADTTRDARLHAVGHGNLPASLIANR